MINGNIEGTGDDIKLQLHVCNDLHDKEWLQMDDSSKKIMETGTQVI